MAAVSCSYPADELIALRAAETERERAAPVAGGIDFAALNFGYRISGDKVPWRPLRIFDDGRQLFVEFGDGIAEGDMPPLFVLGDKDGAELVNYRVRGRLPIVHRLFEPPEMPPDTGRGPNKTRLN